MKKATLLMAALFLAGATTFAGDGKGKACCKGKEKSECHKACCKKDGAKAETAKTESTKK